MGPSSGVSVVSTEPGTVINAALNSSQTGIAYDVYIWLPASYLKSALTYPVVYATDCEYRFSTLKQVMEQRNAQALFMRAAFGRRNCIAIRIDETVIDTAEP